MANLWVDLRFCARPRLAAAFCLNFYGTALAFPFARFHLNKRTFGIKEFIQKRGKTYSQNKKNNIQNEDENWTPVYH